MPFKKVDCKEELDNFLEKNPECKIVVDEFEREMELKKAENQLKEKMQQHLKVANDRGFKDKAMRLTTEEIEIIIQKLS